METARRLTATQENLLRELADETKIPAKGINKRTYRALEDRGFVRVKEQKAGTFLSITPQGKKHLN